MKKCYFAHIITWEESERGWGCRPDGFSLHVSQDEADNYIKEHWKREQEFNAKYGISGVPDEYSRPVSNKAEVVPITSKAAKALTEAHRAGKHGLHMHRKSDFMVDV